MHCQLHAAGAAQSGRGGRRQRGPGAHDPQPRCAEKQRIVLDGHAAAAASPNSRQGRPWDVLLFSGRLQGAPTAAHHVPVAESRDYDFIATTTAAAAAAAAAAAHAGRGLPFEQFPDGATHNGGEERSR